MRGNDEREAYGDIPNVEGLLKGTDVVEHLKHALAKFGLVVFGGTLSAASLADVDVMLRIILSLIGIPAAVYSLLYYRRKYRETDNDDT